MHPGHGYVSDGWLNFDEEKIFGVPIIGNFDVKIAIPCC